MMGYPMGKNRRGLRVVMMSEKLRFFHDKLIDFNAFIVNIIKLLKEVIFISPWYMP